jgi:hypothetical protein
MELQVKVVQLCSNMYLYYDITYLYYDIIMAQSSVMYWTAWTRSWSHNKYSYFTIFQLEQVLYVM